MISRSVCNLAGERRYAVYSADARHPRLPHEARRLLLEVELTPGGVGKRIVFCMCNPSTATEESNDPTVAKIIKFARKFGGALLVVVNAFDWRDTDPKLMRRAAEPSGPANDAAIIGACLRADLVILACGRNGDHLGRGMEVHRMLRSLGVRPCWLRDPRKQDQLEDPHHPLYLHDGCVPEPLHLPEDL